MINITSYRGHVSKRRKSPAQRRQAIKRGVWSLVPWMEGQGRVFHKPEYRALDQIVADAERAGVPVIALGPSGTFEIAAQAAGEVAS